jgi:cation diffusion facilitator family transporter
MLVVILTGTMMVVEIVAGVLTGSMALLADGWHMGSHFAALGLAAFAYRFARRHAADRRYTFGTGKVGPLAGFASAVALGLIAFAMAYESSRRLINPVDIEYSTALLVAVVGLAVNVVSALLLREEHHHDHGHRGPAHAHRHDHNLKAAYVHVLADALTSLLAIVALLGGAVLGLGWLDPVMGIVGAGVIVLWSWGLVRRSARVLLDFEADRQTADSIRSLIQADTGNRVVDLHLWQVGTGHLALILSIVAREPKAPDHYKRMLEGVADLSHVTIEVLPFGPVP